MTRDDIIRWARKAGMQGMLTDVVTTFDELERFAALVAAAERDRMIADGWRQCAVGQRTTQFCAEAERIRAEEREACANLCDEIAQRNESDHDSCWSYGNWECAVAIRARGKTAQAEPDLSHCPYCGGLADCEPGLDSNFCRRCQRA